MNFLMDRSEENKKKYSKQQNYCLSLLRKSKSEYFGNLKKKISDRIIMGDDNTAKVLKLSFL